VTLGPSQLTLIAVAVIAAAGLSFVLTPLAIRLATRWGAIDQPDAERRVHRLPIPRGGGMAVAVSFVVVGVVVVWLDQVQHPNTINPGNIDAPELLALFGGVVVAATFGFVDDRWQIRARWQLLAQLLLAAIAIVGGVLIVTVANPFGFLGGAFSGDELRGISYPISVALTALWIVGMINSVNFIDGLDGLSTGICLIAALTLGIISLTNIQSALQPQPMVGLLSAVLVGALAGFLPWNFYPARVFTGTTGVFVMGYALALLSILGAGKVAVALLVLGVPIIDTFWIIIRRVSAGHSPFTPDRGHFHHRLLDLGLTHRGAVLVIYAISVLLAVLSLILSTVGQLYAFLGIAVGGGLVLYLLTRRGRGSLDARNYPDEPVDGVGPVPSGRDEAVAPKPPEVPLDDGRRGGTRPVG
jgi:UDP-GlcNAc:undecaprenyl-phosphate GlcNAc-1-phosphate transferase